jgi:twitching motility protein PilT
MILEEILAQASKHNCSDVHIVSGQQPILRINGDLVRVPESQILNQNEVGELISQLLNDVQYNAFAQNSEIDFAFEIKGICRFRANVFYTLAGPAIAIRPIENHIRTFSEIAAPEIVKSVLDKRRGLVIVSGPTGSGKSTTLASMIDYINNKETCNIITIEDPIEQVHKSNKSLISQREIGMHTDSFANALKSALRENPDIIMVGEMRDLETFSLALSAAETGHLVLATLHTPSASNAITRIIESFPNDKQALIRSMLSNSLNAVIMQRLIKTKNNSRCAAFEVMVANPSIRNLIREDKVAQMHSMMEIGKKFGMITMKDSILELLKSGIISEKIASEAIASYT